MRSFGNAVGLLSSANDELAQDMEDGQRIIGGEASPQGAWPWMARVRPCNKYGSCVYLCAGSIIDSNWILTAAHCLPYKAHENRKPFKGNVTVGMHHLEFTKDKRGLNTIIAPTNSEGNGVTYPIKRIVQHPQWNAYKRTNDIALLKTSIMEFNNLVQPVCMPSKDICFNEATACVASGWGLDEESGTMPPGDLRELAVKKISMETCSSEEYYGSMV